MIIENEDIVVGKEYWIISVRSNDNYTGLSLNLSPTKVVGIEPFEGIKTVLPVKQRKNLDKYMINDLYEIHDTLTSATDAYNEAVMSIASTLLEEEEDKPRLARKIADDCYENIIGNYLSENGKVYKLRVR